MLPALPELAVPGPLGRTRAGRRLATVLVVAALAIVFVARPARKVWNGNDYDIYHAAARTALEGGDIYEAASADGRLYVYPPTLAILLTPVAWLPVGVGGLLWLGAKLAALIACLRILSRRLPPASGSSAWTVPVLGLACVFTVVDNELCNGQADLWVLASLVFALDATVRGHPFRAGLAVAFGAALKVTPLFLGLWLLGRRSVRGLAGLAVGLVILLLVLPALVLGPSGALRANARFLEQIAEPHVHGGTHEGAPTTDEPGYSVRAAVYRWLAAPRLDGTGDDSGVHALHLAPGVAEWIYRLIAAVLVVLTLIATRPPAREDDPWGCSRELALFAATMVIVAPLSRAAHFVVLLPAAVWVAASWRRRGIRTFAFVLLAAGLLINVPFLFLPRAAKVVLAGNGALLLGALLLWLALLRPRNAERGPLAGPETGPGLPHPATDAAGR